MSNHPISTRLLGAPEFRSGDGTVLPVTPKLTALVAYLDASHPAMVPRTELMDVFWERMFTRQARQNLRKAMDRLRRVLGDDVVVTNGDHVGLNAAQYESDTLVLVRFLRDGADNAVEALQNVAPAEFLAGINIAGERWSDWLASERRRQQDNLLRALTQAAQACANAGDERNAQQFAKMSVRVNPLAEKPRRILMTVLASAGRASEAVQEYKSFAQLLREELDVGPSQQTQALLKSVSQHVRTYGSEGDLDFTTRLALAIMPISALGESRRGADLAVGLQTEIVTTLTKLSNLDIIDLSFLSVLKDHNSKADQPDYDAQTVLKSALQVVGDRVRLTAQLIDMTSNRQIWAERFDRRLADILEIQESMTKEVVTQLQVRLTEGEQARVWSSGTKSFDAWEAIVRATHLIHAHQREGIREARQLAEGAVGIDPDYASAHAAIGWTHWVEGRWFWSENQRASFDTSLQLCRKALSLDPVNPDARTLHGVVLVHLGRYDEALGEMEQAVSLAPSHAHIAALAAYVQRYAGDPKRAIDLIDRAMRLSPGHPPWYLNTKAAALRAIDDLEHAEAALRISHSRDEKFPMTLAQLASLLGQGGRQEEGQAVVHKLMQLEPGFSTKKWCAQNPYRFEDNRKLELDGLLACGAPP